jgi:hypothetical protein
VLSSGSDEQRIDVTLGEQADTAALADIDAFGGGRDQGKYFAADQRIVENNVGRLKQKHSLRRQQFGVTGASANKKDLAGE